MLRTAWMFPLACFGLGALAGKATAESSPLPAPVVVITGGYDSCKYDSNGNWSAFAGNFNGEGVRFLNEMHAQWEQEQWSRTADRGIRWVFACHDRTGGLYVHGVHDAATSQEPMQDLHPIISRIEQLSENYARPIFVIGHSHGGWLAARLVESFRGTVRHGYLITVDPISFVECNPATYADALLSLGKIWETIRPCRQAPGDFTASTFQQIRRNLGVNRWLSYYQQNFIPLHSGAVPGADTNLDMSPFLSKLKGGVAATWNAHVRIANLRSIWHSARVALENFYPIPANMNQQNQQLSAL